MLVSRGVGGGRGCVRCRGAVGVWVETCVRVVPAYTETFWTYTRGHFGRTHGFFSACHTTHHNATAPHRTTQHTTHNTTTTTTTTHGDRDRETVDGHYRSGEHSERRAGQIHRCDNPLGHRAQGLERSVELVALSVFSFRSGPNHSL